MIQKLYLMRHGQTLFNKRKKAQGWCDSPLTEEGRAQALNARKFFEDKNISFDAAYCSTQERASDTLELITDLPYKRLKGIKEWNFGLLEGEAEDLQVSRKVNPGLNNHGNFFVPFGGESNLEVQERVYRTVIDILKEGNKTNLVVSHGGAMWMMFLKFNNPEDIGDKRFSNCCVLEYDFDGESLRFVALHETN